MQFQGLDEDALTQRAVALGEALRPGHVLLLSGTMGAGKTTFTRGIGRGLRLRRPERVCSPTFNICLVHDGDVPLIHVDLFRLDQDESPAFGALGLEALVDGACEEHGLAASGGVVVIEWADLWSRLPSEHLRIAFTRPPGQADVRNLDIEAAGPRHTALVQSWLSRC